MVGFESAFTTLIPLLAGPPCPHHSKSDYNSTAEPVALTATSATDGCPQCASALALRDGLGPVCNVASDQTEEEGMEETDRDDKKTGSKKKDKKGQKSVGNHANRSPSKQCQKLWSQIRKKLWGIVESKYFNRGIMIAILINTISMGIEHHDQVCIF